LPCQKLRLGSALRNMADVIMLSICLPANGALPWLLCQ